MRFKLSKNVMDQIECAKNVRIIKDKIKLLNYEMKSNGFNQATFNKIQELKGLLNNGRD